MNVIVKAINYMPFFALLCLSVALMAGVASEATAQEQPPELELTYDAFDQSPGGGFRRLSDEGKYLEAANLIDLYEKERKDLKQWQRVNLRFHAGQLYAFAEEKDLALAHFKTAFNAKEPSDSPMKWNAYVRATIAFLERDRETLAASREEIAKSPTFQGVVSNLNVVDRLIKYFDEPYRVAYSGKPQTPDAANATTTNGNKVTLDEDSPAIPFVEVTLAGKAVDDASLGQLASALKGLPQPLRLTVRSFHVTDEGLKQLAVLKDLTALHLNCNVTGTGLKYLEGLTNLEELEFDCSAELTNEGFANIKHLKALRRLQLVGASQITDAALDALAELTGLEELNLSYTRVTDAGLEQLTKLTGLRKLHLRPALNAKFSEDSIAELRQALPNCTLEF